MRPAVIALFDLDRTLYPHDTDELWVAFLIAAGELDGARFEAADREMSARYARGEAAAREYCEFYLSTIAGRDDDALLPLRERFMAERVLPAIGDAARALVRNHQAQGHLTVMSTATNRFLSGPIGSAFGFEHVIATEPERVDGRFTGRVAGEPNMRDGKQRRLDAWLAPQGRTLGDFSRSFFYSDSRNDLPLLSAVTDPVAVDPDPELAAHARARGWRQLSLRGSA